MKYENMKRIKFLSDYQPSLEKSNFHELYEPFCQEENNERGTSAIYKQIWSLYHENSEKETGTYKFETPYPTFQYYQGDLLSIGLYPSGEFLWTYDDENRTLMIERFRAQIRLPHEEQKETTMFLTQAQSQRLMLIIETFILEKIISDITKINDVRNNNKC